MDVVSQMVFQGEVVVAFVVAFVVVASWKRRGFSERILLSACWPNSDENEPCCLAAVWLRHCLDKSRYLPNGGRDQMVGPGRVEEHGRLDTSKGRLRSAVGQNAIFSVRPQDFGRKWGDSADGLAGSAPGAILCSTVLPRAGTARGQRLRADIHLTAEMRLSRLPKH